MLAGLILVTATAASLLTALLTMSILGGRKRRYSTKEEENDNDTSAPKDGNGTSSKAQTSYDEKEVEAEERRLWDSFTEHQSLAENICDRLKLLQAEKSNVLHSSDMAIINIARRMLQSNDVDISVPYGLFRTDRSMGSTQSIEVQEWLREAFTKNTNVQKYQKRSIKVVTKSIMFAVRMKRAIKSGNDERDFLPFKASAEEEAAIKDVMKDVDYWKFDIWALNKASGGRELQVLGWYLLHEWGVAKKFGLEAQTLKNWLVHVQGCYLPNQFHSATHAADVLQTTHYMLKTGKMSAFLSELEILAILVAAMVHDMGHDGFTNNYHKNAVTSRAIVYNDQSIQEMYHISSFFAGIKDTENVNILQSFSTKQFLEFRTMVIQLVLATDMSQHFQELKDFKVLISEKGASPEAWTDSTVLLMKFVLHSCDISAQGKARHLAITWAERCHEEFFHQGDTEKEKQLPISPLCDRLTTDIGTSQDGFISFIVLPTWTTLGDLFPAVHEDSLPLLKSNLEFWKSKIAVGKELEEKAPASPAKKDSHEEPNEATKGET